MLASFRGVCACYCFAVFVKISFALQLSQRTPLHVAAEEGRDYTVEYLVGKGANVNIKNYDGVCVSNGTLVLLI